MTCNNQGIEAKISDRSAPKIVQGSDGFLLMQLVYRGTSDPAAINSFVGATGFFPKEDGSALAVSGALVSADRGTVRFDLDSTETADLNEGEENNFEMSVEDASGLHFYQLEAKLSVSARYF